MEKTPPQQHSERAWVHLPDPYAAHQASTEHTIMEFKTTINNTEADVNALLGALESFSSRRQGSLDAAGETSRQIEKLQQLYHRGREQVTFKELDEKQVTTTERTSEPAWENHEATEEIKAAWDLILKTRNNEGLGLTPKKEREWKDSVHHQWVTRMTPEGFSELESNIRNLLAPHERMTRLKKEIDDMDLLKAFYPADYERKLTQYWNAMDEHQSASALLKWRVMMMPQRHIFGKAMEVLGRDTTRFYSPFRKGIDEERVLAFPFNRLENKTQSVAKLIDVKVTENNQDRTLSKTEVLEKLENCKREKMLGIIQLYGAEHAYVRMMQALASFSTMRFEYPGKDGRNHVIYPAAGFNQLADLFPVHERGDARNAMTELGEGKPEKFVDLMTNLRNNTSLSVNQEAITVFRALLDHMKRTSREAVEKDGAHNLPEVKIRLSIPGIGKGKADSIAKAMMAHVMGASAGHPPETPPTH